MLQTKVNDVLLMTRNGSKLNEQRLRTEGWKI